MARQVRELGVSGVRIVLCVWLPPVSFLAFLVGYRLCRSAQRDGHSDEFPMQGSRPFTQERLHLAFTALISYRGLPNAGEPLQTHFPILST